jgi:hypothetical protein
MELISSSHLYPNFIFDKNKQYLEHLPHRENSVFVKLLATCLSVNITEIKTNAFVSLLRSKQEMAAHARDASLSHAKYTSRRSAITVSKRTFGIYKLVLTFSM